MKASPGARSWIAAGVRHELLTRALPALRHDMAAPVSVIRMGLLLIKRQSGDAGQLEQRVGLIEEQLDAMVSGVRSLRDWELGVDGEGIARNALVTQCVRLMRTAFELNGIGLQVSQALEEAADGDAGAAAPQARFPAAAALRYMFLGALGHLHDSTPGLGTVRIDAEGSDGLRFTADAGESEVPDPMAGALRAPRTLAIDAIALQALADALGYHVAVEGNAVHLRLTPA